MAFCCYKNIWLKQDYFINFCLIGFGSEKTAIVPTALDSFTALCECACGRLKIVEYRKKCLWIRSECAKCRINAVTHSPSQTRTPTHTHPHSLTHYSRNDYDIMETYISNDVNTLKSNWLATECAVFLISLLLYLIFVCKHIKSIQRAKGPRTTSKLVFLSKLLSNR